MTVIGTNVVASRHIKREGVLLPVAVRRSKTPELKLNFIRGRGVTALTRAVSGEKQIYSGNLEILRGIGKPGNFFGKFEIFSGH